MGCLFSKNRATNEDVYRSMNDSSYLSRGIDIGTEDLVTGRAGTVTADYGLVCTVGTGAFGEVKKGIHKRTGHTRAIKILHKEKLSQDDRAHLLREVEILKKLDHPNIIKVYEYYENEKSFFIVTDLCEGPELFDRVSDKGHLSEFESAKIMEQVLSAITYCHSHQIVHRDLKPENILFDNNKEESNIKVIDFGASNVFRKNEIMHERIGTPYYIAPEMLGGNYTEKVDTWSCGVLLYILLVGYPPFNGDSNASIFKSVQESELYFDKHDWEGVSPEAKDLVMKLIVRDPSKRLSAEQALNHPWFEKTTEHKEVDPEKAKAALKRLREFHAGRKLHDAIWVYMTNFLLSKEEKDEMLDLFKQFDKNGDGQLSKEELLEGYQKMFGKQVSGEDIDEIMNELDKNRSGFIDYSEFVTAVVNKDNLLSKEKLEKTFTMLDKDGSGKISTKDLKEIFGGSKSTLTDRHWKKIISEADKDHDGEV